MTSIATKGGAVIVKDGKAAEVCACCDDGGWYCYSEYGACSIGGKCSIQCESDCKAAGGTFHGRGSVCCTTGAVSQRPASVVLSFGGTRPEAYGHGCTAKPSGVTRDGNWDLSAGWTPENVFQPNAWPAALTLTHGPFSPDNFTFVYSGWNGTGTPSIATAKIACSHVGPNGKLAWRVDSISMEVYSVGVCVGWTSPNSFHPNGVKGFSCALIWKLSAQCKGDSVAGISISSQSVTSENSAGLGADDPLRPQPIFCNLNISGWKITGVTIS